VRRAVAALWAPAVAASVAAPGLSVAAAASPPAAGRIAFDDFLTNQIYALNADGTALTQLTRQPAGIAARWPGWSPGGSHILFARFNLSTGMGRIWIMNADGAAQRQLASDAPGYRDYQPRCTASFTTASTRDGPCTWGCGRASL
jgi:hypothetical protein